MDTKIGFFKIDGLDRNDFTIENFKGPTRPGSLATRFPPPALCWHGQMVAQMAHWTNSTVRRRFTVVVHEIPEMSSKTLQVPFTFRHRHPLPFSHEFLFINHLPGETATCSMYSFLSLVLVWYSFPIHCMKLLLFICRKNNEEERSSNARAQPYLVQLEACHHLLSCTLRFRSY